METFEKILDIYNANSENFDLEFFICRHRHSKKKKKIHKVTENKLIDKKKFLREK